MSQSEETVLVVRKDHPDGKVLINKSDMKDSDVEYSPESNQQVEVKASTKSRAFDLKG